MKNIVARKIGVDAGIILISDRSFYEKYGNKTGVSPDCYKTFKVANGSYKVSWNIKNTWNGNVSGSGIVNISSGVLCVSDPCYLTEDWDAFLKDTKTGCQEPEGTVLCDSMGGDGEYTVHITLEPVEPPKSKMYITVSIDVDVPEKDMEKVKTYGEAEAYVSDYIKKAFNTGKELKDLETATIIHKDK